MASGEESGAGQFVSGPQTGGGPAKVTIRTILGDRPVRAIMLITFVVMLGFGIIAPILPLYARSFGVGYADAGLLISSYAFTRLICDPFTGPIVDRYGERVVATAGLMFVGVSSVLTGLAPTFTLAVVFRGVGGAGSAVLFAALYSYLLKIVPKHRMARTLGVFYGSFNVGFIAGGPIGGVIAHLLGLASPLFFYAALCFLSGLLYLRFVPDPQDRRVEGGASEEEPEPAEEPAMWQGTVRAVRDLLRSRVFVTTIVLNMAFFWVIAGGYDTLVPLFGQSSLHMSTVGIGAALAVAVAVEFVLLYPAGTIADRFGRRALLLPALTWFAVALAAAGWSGSPIFFGFMMAVVGVGSGTVAVAPAAMLSDVVPERRSGTAVGVFRFFGDLGFVFGPLVAGASAGAFGFKGAFALMAVPLVVALGLVAVTPETLSRPSTHPVAAG
jgi:DHA1 family multidrug resistance protein-like MFS transporter